MSALPKFVSDVPTEFTKGTKEALATMAKALPKNSIRSYAQVIGFQNKAAYITDAYGLLELKVPELPSESCYSVDRHLFTSQVKFPQTSSVIPTGGILLSLETTLKILELVNALGSKPVKGLFLAIQGDKVTLFSGDAFPCSSNILNPWTIKTFLKGVPKSCRPTKALLNSEGVLRIYFSSSLGEVEMSLVVTPVINNA